MTPDRPERSRNATAWMDSFWDEQAGLLRDPDGGDRHLVRETSWYALGLLQRDERGDVDRARRALEAVLGAQFNSPGQPWHGTFARAPEEGLPGPQATCWVDYDPNWRQFIGCVLSIAVEDFADALGPDLVAAADVAMVMAVESEDLRRVTPDYSNIALLKAWLEARVGLAAGEALGRQVSDRFNRWGTFDEYNSPTYYGVDLWALALWRDRPPAPFFARAGRAIGESVWSDVALLYHAGLGNLCGAYDRSYGMDMGTYASLLGLAMWKAIGTRGAFPDPTLPFAHSADFCFGPLLDAASPIVPEVAHPALLRFPGPHRVERQLSGRRMTAVLDDTFMMGGQTGGRGGSPQYHPATLHWQLPDGSVGWIRARSRGRLDAEASDDGLRLSASAGTISVDLHAQGWKVQSGAEPWSLPGLTVEPVSNHSVHVAEDADDIRYRFGAAGDHRVRLELHVTT